MLLATLLPPALADSEAAAVAGAHAIAVLTEWKQFRALDYAALFATMQRPAFVFDGRNILDHAALRKIGFQVYCVGKPGVDAIDMDNF